MVTCQAKMRNGLPCRNKGKRKYVTDTGKTVCLCGLHDKIYKIPKTPIAKHKPLIRVHNPDQSCDDFTHRSHIYPNQMTAGKKIVTLFKNGKTKVLCAAPMQSGKTGTAKAAIGELEAFCESKNKILRTFLVLPLNDNELLEQARAEFSEYIPIDHIFGAPMLQHQRYLKVKMEQDRRMYPNSMFLIIIDESQIGVEKDSSLDKLFKKAGIKISEKLPESVHMLTLSATPNAETALLTYKEVKDDKAIVVLEPGDSYYGVKDMLHKGKLRLGWSLDEQGLERLVETTEQFMDTNKYMLIRCNDKARIDSLRDMLKEKYGDRIKVTDYSSRSDVKDINTKLELQPTKPELILLAQRLKASKQVKTKNVSMCFEYGKSFCASLQGLLGRGCGNGKEEHGVVFYCNIEHAELYIKWWETNFNPFSTPNDNHFVINGVTSKTLLWKKNIPQELILSEEVRSIIRDNMGHFSRCYGSLNSYLKPLWEEQYPNLATKYSSPIKSNGVMVLSKDSSGDSSYQSWWVGPSKAGVNRTKMIGFDTSNLKRNTETGYFMYINADTMKCYVCYSHRTSKAEAEPIVKDKCAYKPEGELTRVKLLKARLK